MKIYLLTVLLFILSCSPDIDDAVLIKMLKGDNKEQFIEAIMYIEDNHKIDMVQYLLYDAMDPRVTHDIRFKGMSIYQIKMHALKRFTGTNPPKRITSEPDSSILNFYADILKQRGWIVTSP
jgi:hypothetical protein